MDVLQSAIGADMQHVDAVIKTALHSDVRLIRQVAEHIIQSGGKRLRPALLVLAARLCGADDQAMRHAYQLAAVIEIIHTTSLLHDDVVDDSDMRRGKQTANLVFGNAASILVGDFLYSRAFQMMVDTGMLPVLRVLSDATNQIAEGEVLQLLNMHDPDIAEEKYFQVVECKTAKLFEAAARLGAVVSNATPDCQEALASYGHHLGMAFQITDDVLDFMGEESMIGKCIGDDLAEGKPTLPLIYALQHTRGAQATLIRDAIIRGDRSNLTLIIDIIKESGAIEYTQKRSTLFMEAGKCALNAFPDSFYKKILVHLLSFVVERAV